jgi:hypothetical protein
MRSSFLAVLIFDALCFHLNLETHHLPFDAAGKALNQVPLCEHEKLLK